MQRKMPRNVNQPQICPVVAVSLDVSATENGSYKILRTLTLLLTLTVG